MHPSEWGEEGQFGHLMPSQQRALRKLVEDRIELDEEDFDLILGDGSWAGWVDQKVPVVLYEPEQFFFGLTYIPPGLRTAPRGYSGHTVYFRPGNEKLDDQNFGLKWPDVHRYFGDWLGYIARELDLEDDPELEDDESGEYEEVDEPDQGEEGNDVYVERVGATPASNRPKIFICHSSKDKAFARDLVVQLEGDGVDAWFDELEIRIGESIHQKINDGLKRSDFFAVVLSRSSVKSKWVQDELSSASTMEKYSSEGIFVLPILLEDCDVPPLLLDRRYANFKEDRDSAYRELVDAIYSHFTDRHPDADVSQLASYLGGRRGAG